MVSILGFGASEIGFRKSTEAEVDRLMGLALDHGINVLDTAECYLQSEERLGQALQGRRADVYLFTKCGHASGLTSPDWEKETLQASIDRSLVRLRTDYVDVIHLHSCSREVLARGEVVDVLTQAKAAGKARYIGYSGDSEDARYALELGVFDSLETSVNIADQQALTMTLPKAVVESVGVVAKRPIANVAWRYRERPLDEYVLPYWQRLKVLNYPALATDEVDASVALALKFTWSVAGVGTAIVGTSSAERLMQNIRTAESANLSEDLFKDFRQRWQEVSQPTWVGLE